MGRAVADTVRVEKLDTRVDVVPDTDTVDVFDDDGDAETVAVRNSDADRAPVAEFVTEAVVVLLTGADRVMVVLAVDVFEFDGHFVAVALADGERDAIEREPDGDTDPADDTDGASVVDLSADRVGASDADFGDGEPELDREGVTDADEQRDGLRVRVTDTVAVPHTEIRGVAEPVIETVDVRDCAILFVGVVDVVDVFELLIEREPVAENVAVFDVVMDCVVVLLTVMDAVVVVLTDAVLVPVPVRVPDGVIDVVREEVVDAVMVAVVTIDMDRLGEPEPGEDADAG